MTWFKKWQKKREKSKADCVNKEKNGAKKWKSSTKTLREREKVLKNIFFFQKQKLNTSVDKKAPALAGA